MLACTNLPPVPYHIVVSTRRHSVVKNTRSGITRVCMVIYVFIVLFFLQNNAQFLSPSVVITGTFSQVGSSLYIAFASF